MVEERILVVEDDETIAVNLVRALIDQGYHATHVSTGAEALTVNLARIDLMLLDLGLPDIDGVEVCRRLLAMDPTLPILMLTARQEEIDIVVGLDAGAVDYVTKPFRLAELLARIRAGLRQGRAGHEHGPFVIGDFRLDPDSRRVWVGEEELTLRAKEFDLLTALVIDAGSVVTRERLMTDVWDQNWYGSTKTLDVHIAALRRKFQSGGPEISTLRGVGYRLEVP